MKTSIEDMDRSKRGDKDTQDIPGRKVKEKYTREDIESRQHDPK